VPIRHRRRGVLKLDPDASVDQLVGIGPRLREGLAREKVDRIRDLLFHVPYRWEDRTRRMPLDRRLTPNEWILVCGRVSISSVRHARRRRMRIVTGRVDDGLGVLPVVWFNQPWIARWLREDTELSLYGPVRRGRDGRLEMVNPELNEIDEGGVEAIVPVYRKLGPLSGRRLRRLVQQALEAAPRCVDPLPESLRRELGFPELSQVLLELHDPPIPDDDESRRRVVDDLNRRASRGHRRLAFDELLAFACVVADHRSRRLGQRAPMCPGEASLDDLARQMFPFSLTSAQRRVVGEIIDDLGRPYPMARLIQGDVGSGKTAVATLALRVALEAGHQGALMAPTELLAEQHARTLESFFRETGFEIGLLSASLPAADRRAVRSGLADGRIRLAVGTHALLQESTRFQNLALVVVDEQHRFGVSHRQALLEKGTAPHMLVMTATPIPRSLALTVYGDLELSIIDELPPGRRPVQTVVRTAADRAKLCAFLAEVVAEGGRVFFVCPAIEHSDDTGLPAVEDLVGELRSSLPEAVIGVVHGRMTRSEREQTAESFRDGRVQVLVATTVVEVGVDVAEASVMVVEAAERFGLSQLHQLRGRVGRGERRSWCVLLAGSGMTEEARRRLDVLCRSNDGFEIAEADLVARGPGELTGLRQWGPADFRFANLVRDRDLVERARSLAGKLAKEGGLAEIRRGLARYFPGDPKLPAG
jgi:ATP-dependent DNA helicase RecG